jgi:hypothetical protein
VSRDAVAAEEEQLVETCCDMLEAMARIAPSQPNQAMARIAPRSSIVLIVKTKLHST